MNKNLNRKLKLYNKLDKNLQQYFAEKDFNFDYLNFTDISDYIDNYIPVNRSGNFAICAIMKNTPIQLLNKWILHYQKFNCDIYIYQDTNSNVDYLEYIYQNFSYINNIYVYKLNESWRELGKYSSIDCYQCSLYNLIYKELKNFYSWICFLDDDEFLEVHNSVFNLNVPGIYAPWIVKVSNNFTLLDDFNEIVFNNYKKLYDLYYVKTIINTKYNETIINIHFTTLDGVLYDVYGNEYTIYDILSEKIKYDVNSFINSRAYINHYLILSFETYIKQIYDRGDLFCKKLNNGICIPNRIAYEYYQLTNNNNVTISDFIKDLNKINRSDIIEKIYNDPIKYAYKFKLDNDFLNKIDIKKAFKHYTQNQIKDYIANVLYQYEILDTYFKEKLAICLAFNNTYINYAKTLIKSLIINNTWFDGDIIIMGDEEINITEELLNELKTIYPNVIQKKFHKTDKIKQFIEKYRSHLYKESWVYSYLKIYLFELDEYDKVLWLDTDIIINGDISEIFESNDDINVAIDLSMQYNATLCNNYYFQNQYLDYNEEYCNAGIIYLGNKLFKSKLKNEFLDFGLKYDFTPVVFKKAWCDKAFELIQYTCVGGTFEQDVLNMFLKEHKDNIKFRLLPIKYNTCTDTHSYFINNATIIHYWSKPNDLVKAYRQSTISLSAAFSSANIYNKYCDDDQKIQIKSKLKYALAIIFNDAYVPGAFLFLKTFFKHNPWHKGDIICFFDDKHCCISEENKKMFQNTFPNLYFKCVDYHNYDAFIDHFYEKLLHKWFVVSAYTLEAFGLKYDQFGYEYDRVVYLDIDQIVEGDLSLLFFNDKDIVAAPGNNVLINDINDNLFQRQKLNISGGLFSISKKYLGNDIKNEIIKFGENFEFDKPEYGNWDGSCFEMHVLNVWLLDKDVWLTSSTYAFQSVIIDAKFDKNSFNIIKDELFMKSKIIHIWDEKPWNKKDSYISVDLYWKNIYDSLINNKIPISLNDFYKDKLIDNINNIEKNYKSICQKYNIKIITNY